MAALRNQHHILSVIVAAACVAATTPAAAQAPKDNAAAFSRVHPDSRLPRVTQPDGSVLIAPVPPPLLVTPSPPPVGQAKEPEVLPPPVSTERLVDTMRICVQVVQAGPTVNLSPLLDASWGYTDLQSVSNELGSFQKVDYLKDNLTISLQDFGNNILCRGIGMIANDAQFDEVRTALVKSLGAVPAVSAPGYELAARFIADRDPRASIANVYILGDHIIEIATLDNDLSQSGIVGAGIQKFGLLTASPTAGSLRKFNQSLEAK